MKVLGTWSNEDHGLEIENEFMTQHVSKRSGATIRGNWCTKYSEPGSMFLHK